MEIQSKVSFTYHKVCRLVWEYDAKTKCQNRKFPKNPKASFDAACPTDSKMGPGFLSAQQAKKVERFEVFGGRPQKTQTL